MTEATGVTKPRFTQAQAVVNLMVHIQRTVQCVHHLIELETWFSEKYEVDLLTGQDRQLLRELLAPAESKLTGMHRPGVLSRLFERVQNVAAQQPAAETAETPETGAESDSRGSEGNEAVEGNAAPQSVIEPGSNVIVGVDFRAGKKKPG